MVEWKQAFRRDFFFENKLLLQPDVVFDYKLNRDNFRALAPPGGEEKYFQFFFHNDVQHKNCWVTPKTKHEN